MHDDHDDLRRIFEELEIDKSAFENIDIHTLHNRLEDNPLRAINYLKNTLGEKEYARLVDGLHKNPSLADQIRSYSKRHPEVSRSRLQELRDNMNDIEELIDQSGLAPVIEFVVNLMSIGAKLR